MPVGCILCKYIHAVFQIGNSQYCLSMLHAIQNKCLTGGSNYPLPFRFKSKQEIKETILHFHCCARFFPGEMFDI